MTASVPTRRARRPAFRFPVAVAPLLCCGLAACNGQDPVDTPVSWWHQLQGGVIAEQRPPPPGVDAPYPAIGTTPARPPTIASADLRRSVTDQLEQQRNLSARLNAESPLPPPAAPPPPKLAATPVAAATPAAAPNPNQSSATLDAVEAPANPVPPPTAPAASTAGHAAATADPDAAELAMPAYVPPATGTAAAQPPAPIPAIAQTPPDAPALPGLGTPPAPSYMPPPHPDFALGEGRGERLFFPNGSDALATGQDATLRGIATHRRDGTIVVHGYGDAGSDAPADQAAAIALASLRARSVAEALQKDGVPASSIRLTADAFGRGARAELIN